MSMRRRKKLSAPDMPQRQYKYSADEADAMTEQGICPLKDFSSWALVRELQRRGDVDFAQIGPYDHMTFKVEGPRHILFVK